MKNFNSIKGFVLGVATCVLVAAFAFPALAANIQKQATLDYLDIQITVDGQRITPTDANGNTVEPFAIDGTTYLPVRAVANALGINVGWDGDTKTVILGEQPVSSIGNNNEDTAVDSSTVTTGQKNALQSAKRYLEVLPFSYTGLIEQLEYEKYTTEEATYAADNCGADWFEQAVKSAEKYLSIMSFSRSGLIEQLEYEGFTHEQAVYGAEANGY